jgi:hypothetical protein
MNTANVSLVPLRQASLCLDCETISAAHTNCAACGSRSLLSLARVLSQHPAGLSATAIPLPLHRRHSFYPTDSNSDGRPERLDASPARFGMGIHRSRRETFES